VDYKKSQYRKLKDNFKLSKNNKNNLTIKIIRGKAI
jgi:hypothetical protein